MLVHLLYNCYTIIQLLYNNNVSTMILEIGKE